MSLGDLCDLHRSLRHYCLPQYCSRPLTQDLLGGSRRTRRHSISRMQFHQPFRSWWPWVTSVTFRSQKVTFAYGSLPITRHLLSWSRRAWRHSIRRMRFHQPFRSWWPWLTSVTFRSQKVTFAYGSLPITRHLLSWSRRAWRHSIQRMRFHQPFRSWWPSVTSVTFRGSKGHFCLWQPSYNSASTEPIETSLASFDPAYAISSAVSKLVTLGDLCDLQGSKGHFPLRQPSYNSASTEPIEMSLASFDSAYEISSAVSKLVTLGDLCDLQGSKGHFCLWQPSYNLGHPLGRSRRAWHHSIQRMRFHQPFRNWWPSVTSVTFRGQKVTFPYGSHL